MQKLSRDEFKKWAYNRYMRTGENFVNRYSEYIEWIGLRQKKREVKSFGLGIDKANLDPNKQYCVWGGGSCSGCAEMAGMIFEVSSQPSTYDNCQCSCDLLDSKGQNTGQNVRPEPKKKEKKQCAKVTSRPGGRQHPVPGASSNHKGVDISAPKGTPIKAIEGGVVSHAGLGNSGLHGGLGYFVEIINSDGEKSGYGHMDEQPSVSKGDFVSTGEEIGVVGSTGYSSGNHLHFDVKGNDGNHIDPTDEQIQDLLDMLNAGCKEAE